MKQQFADVVCHQRSGQCLESVIQWAVLGQQNITFIMNPPYLCIFQELCL